MIHKYTFNLLSDLYLCYLLYIQELILINYFSLQKIRNVAVFKYTELK